MADRVEINMSRIKIAGTGGLGMLAMVGVVAYAMPEVRQFVLLSYGAGTGPTLMSERADDAVPAIAAREADENPLERGHRLRHAANIP